MKKLLTILALILLVSRGYSQPCQAKFSMQYDSVTSTLNLNDLSFNTDSTPIQVTMRYWFVSLISDTNIYSPVAYLSDSIVSNPHFPIPSGFVGKAIIEQEIETATSCFSGTYDSIYINIIPNTACQASFTYNYDSIANILYVSSTSYNTDSTALQIDRLSWGATGYSVYNWHDSTAYIQLNGSQNNIPVCLQIDASGFCESTYCNTINLNINPVVTDTCVAAFTFTIDSTQNPPVAYFYNNSYTNHGSIVSTSWRLYHNTLPVDSSLVQNPVIQFQPNGHYYMCLTITTSTGCSSNVCVFVRLADSGNLCQPNVNAFVNQVSIPNASDGSIDLTVTSGQPPYSYSWNTGATTQDIANLPSGFYTVAIKTRPECPIYNYSYTILEPYDSINLLVDTLYTDIVDTCFAFVVDSFNIGSINVQGHSVIVEWDFYGNGQTQTLFITYNYTNYGPQAVELTVNCTGAKDLTTYISYIYISQIYSIAENSFENEVKLFPNPVTDYLNIAFGKLNTKPEFLRIYNSSGKQVLNKPIDNNAVKLEINISSLPFGVYYAQLFFVNDKVLIKKFIK